MVLPRVEQKRKEVGVAQLLPDDAERLEDVELCKEGLKLIQIAVVDDEVFEDRTIRVRQAAGLLVPRS